MDEASPPPPPVPEPAPPPIWAGPLARSGQLEDPKPNPKPVYSRWEGGPLSFGPRGRIALIAAQFGLRVLLWDVDTRDWAGAGAATMVAAVRARGGVVLFHLHGLHTLEAVQALA